MMFNQFEVDGQTNSRLFGGKFLRRHRSSPAIEKIEKNIIIIRRAENKLLECVIVVSHELLQDKSRSKAKTASIRPTMMRKAAAAWRPALRSFYKRVHPDLLGQLPEHVQSENQSSMQELENILSNMPSGKVNLRFHVVHEDRKSVEQIARLSVVGGGDSQSWSRRLDDALLLLLRDVVSPDIMPEHVKDALRYQAKEKEMRARHQLDRRTGSSVEEMAEGWSKFQGEWVEAARQTKYNAQRIRETAAQQSAWYWRQPISGETFSETPGQAISKLFEKDRLRCSSGIDPEDGLEFALAVLKRLGLEHLQNLETALLRDIIIQVVDYDTKTALKGQAIQISMKLTPERASSFVAEVIEKFVEVHNSTIKSSKRSIFEMYNEHRSSSGSASS